MQKLQIAITAVALVTAIQARATLYDISFHQTGESDQYGNATPASVTDANGAINVASGSAINGWLTITTGPDAGNYILVPGSGDDGLFVYDNLIYPSLVNGGFLDGSAGLLWSQSGVAGNSPEMNMWFNPVSQWSQPAGSYSLWGAPPTYNPEAYGTATLTAVPEASTMLAGVLMLLPLGVSAVRIVRKNVIA
jgi:hypothetical protein